MSFPPRPPLVPYGLPPGVVPMPMATHVMVGAYGAGGTGPVGGTVGGVSGLGAVGSMAGMGGVGGGARGALLPAPGGVKAPAVISRPPMRQANGAREVEGPPVTVFIGNITARAPETMIRALLGACGPVISWKRVATFGFCEFAGPEPALRCVRLLHDRPVGDKRLLARTDGKMQALVDTYKTEQRERSRTEGAPGEAGGGDGAGDEYLDARQRAVDEAAQARMQQILVSYQDEINNYETLQKEEAISKTARVLEEAEIAEEKRDVIHREIGKFRESMKGAEHANTECCMRGRSTREYRLCRSVVRTLFASIPVFIIPLFCKSFIHRDNFIDTLSKMKGFDKNWYCSYVVVYANIPHPMF